MRKVKSLLLLIACAVVAPHAAFAQGRFGPDGNELGPDRMQQWLVPTPTQFVNFTSHQLFARSRFAENEDGGIRGCDKLDLTKNHTESPTLSDQFPNLLLRLFYRGKVRIHLANRTIGPNRSFDHGYHRSHTSLPRSSSMQTESPSTRHGGDYSLCPFRSLLAREQSVALSLGVRCQHGMIKACLQPPLLWLGMDKQGMEFYLSAARS